MFPHWYIHSNSITRKQHFNSKISHPQSLIHPKLPFLKHFPTVEMYPNPKLAKESKGQKLITESRTICPDIRIVERLREESRSSHFRDKPPYSCRSLRRVKVSKVHFQEVCPPPKFFGIFTFGKSPSGFLYLIWCREGVALVGIREWSWYSGNKVALEEWNEIRGWKIE